MKGVLRAMDTKEMQDSCLPNRTCHLDSLFVGGVKKIWVFCMNFDPKGQKTCFFARNREVMLCVTHVIPVQR